MRRSGRLERLSRALTGAASLVLAACSTAGYNATHIDAPDVAGRPAKVKTSIAIEGLELELSSSDTVREGEPIPPLSLQLVFEPREIGYSFDPGQVRLRDGTGAEWQPSTADRGNAGSSCHHGSGVGYTFLGPGSCFVLSFSRRVQPGEELELQVAGLALGQRRIDPVTLRISRRSWRKTEHIWPLEIAAYILIPSH